MVIRLRIKSGKEWVGAFSSVPSVRAAASAAAVSLDRPAIFLQSVGHTIFKADFSILAIIGKAFIVLNDDAALPAVLPCFPGSPHDLY